MVRSKTFQNYCLTPGQGMPALYANTKRVASLRGFARAIENGNGEMDN